MNVFCGSRLPFLSYDPPMTSGGSWKMSNSGLFCLKLGLSGHSQHSFAIQDCSKPTLQGPRGHTWSSACRER